jgi:hypothetical protein
VAAKGRREERQDAIEAGQDAQVALVRRDLERILLVVRNQLLNLPGAHDRVLDISGGVLRAEGMTIPAAHQKHGLGRAFMQNASDLCALIGIDRIHLAPHDVGRYVWIRCGFLPEQGSWDTLRRSMMPKLIDLQEELPSERFAEIMTMLRDRRPVTARLIAGLPDPVQTQIPTEQGRMLVPLGRVLLLDSGAIWQGDLDPRDEESMLLLRGK